jgi:ribosome-binding ATPase
MQSLEKAIPRLEKEIRLDKSKVVVLEAAQKAQEILNEGKTLFSVGFDVEPIRELFLLTTKPFVYVVNADEVELSNADFRTEMKALVAPAEVVS